MKIPPIYWTIGNSGVCEVFLFQGVYEWRVIDEDGNTRQYGSGQAGDPTRLRLWTTRAEAEAVMLLDLKERRAKVAEEHAKWAAREAKQLDELIAALEGGAAR